MFYPYYGHKGAVRFAALGPRAIASQPNDELQAWEDVVNRVETMGVISEDSGEFLVNPELLAAAFPDAITRHSVLQAVAAANATPLAPPARLATLATAAAPTASGASAADIIKDILGIGADIPNIQQNVTDIAAGTKVVKKHWWGIELAFTQKAAAALGSLLGKNIGGVTTLLSALATIPALAVLGAVSTITAAILKGIAAWIDAANESGNGVLLTLYAWIFPFFLSATTPVRVP
jgi:hypothetical protein